MQHSPTDSHSLILFWRYAIGTLLIWTIIIASSLSWSLYLAQEQAMNLAHKEAIANFNKDQGFRFWGTKHGGVYVPISENTPPSPYMAHVPDRDIKTPSGVKLTLMNPAYMVRQLMEDHAGLYGIRGKITGLVVLRPGNAPDAWEEAALHRLKNGENEVMEISDLDGQPYLRLMRPMYMKKSCEKCHAHLGFKEGDFRGGVDVSVPVTPYINDRDEAAAAFITSHLVIWLLGIGGISFGTRQVRKRIIESQRVERLLSRHKNELELEVKQRTSDLLKAKDEAETSNRAKSDFLANMSHEIRTPMNAILGFSQLLQNSNSMTPDQRENVDYINRSGEHLLGLINDVLEMSKIEAGRLQLKPATFNLLDLLEDLMVMFKVRTDSKKLSFELDKQKELPGLIVTDEGKLRQIIINLLGNAVKFTDQGGIILRASCQAATGNEASLILNIEVEDSGRGIDEDELPKLFQPFQQAAAGVAQNGGTGLGLAIAREHAQLMGGDISVDSEPDKGSIFRCFIPCEPGYSKNLNRPAQEHKVIGLKPGQESIRILIADDRTENRILLNKILDPIGFELHDAKNGLEAVEQFQSWQPQLILMDIFMPKMDGRDAIRKIRTLPGGKDIAIIAVSASVFEEERQDVLNTGADSFLRKPINHSQLLTEIGQQLKLEFEYAETTSIEQKNNAGILPENLSSITKEILQEMRVAVANYDMNLMYQLIKQTAVTDPELANGLRQIMDRIEWDTFESLLGGLESRDD